MVVVLGFAAAIELFTLLLMVPVGRMGPLTVASALAVRNRRRLFGLPEERPIVG